MSTNLPTIQINEEELFSVLRNSLYVGAQDESIKMVIGYCKATNLDPMQKPVHIVPMYCSTGQKDSKGDDIKSKRDVVMPGIGLYRIQAARSGEFAGTSEPEFGEDITEIIDGITITFPQWCRVTVKRLMSNGVVAEFTSKEFWKENYATKSKDSKAPNAMWAKRPYAQLAKCAEAQALRKAFPEVGSQPTADEMEGKEIDITQNSTNSVSVETKLKSLPLLNDEYFGKKSEVWKKSMIEKNETAENLLAFLQTKYSFTEDQIETIKSWEIENANS